MAMRKDEVVKGSKWMSALTATGNPDFHPQMTKKLPDQRIPRSKFVKKAEVWEGPDLPPNSDGSPIIRYPPPMYFPPEQTPAMLAARTHGMSSKFAISSASGDIEQSEWFHGTWF
mmetsp:Transcript_424/g.558  ORF Transcript_424/g.558 Transcript_424/m.558 type:complete len:115 (-) Transcript_424:305-649(-)|eukprot:CAMPEP_0175095566 /NCGR_PEP_ID=MMETSP0086_2-20121207/4230_1 /TAXON_ID=136419 /ORGANISM="Unknown Unknown, Strain D1" /LENGTH=114 /DNA_ID=CAMNT_0016368835 /DNA_START=47 /DNA_END=391 /DNA_ORIENTATION=+